MAGTALPTSSISRHFEESEATRKLLNDANHVKATEKGKLEDKLEEKLEIARNLKSKAIAFEIIAETTGLSIDEIEKL